jgi:hypothetical protein
MVKSIDSKDAKNAEVTGSKNSNLRGLSDSAVKIAALGFLILLVVKDFNHENTKNTNKAWSCSLRCSAAESGIPWPAPYAAALYTG